MTQGVRCLHNVQTPGTSPQALLGIVLRLRCEMGVSERKATSLYPKALPSWGACQVMQEHSVNFDPFAQVCMCLAHTYRSDRHRQAQNVCGQLLQPTHGQVERVEQLTVCSAL